MHRLIIPAALAAVLAPLTAAPAVSAPTAARAYVDKRVRDCAGKRPGCRPGAVAHYWYKRGSSARGVGWVYASREGARSGTACWLVKKPGGIWKAASGWKRAARPTNGTFVQTSWGRDGHTGLVYPRGTQVCVQFKGLSTKGCVSLK
ncbi:hypothetical protein QBA37_35205 [Streptomyces silvae]|uniref:Peptidase C51 domain-containing protein n=1 Tax=Streptomyces silvae TaxID=2803812 RepID=A0ABU8ADG1_9ACTN